MPYIYIYGWPEPYICTVFDRIFGHFPAKITVYRPFGRELTKHTFNIRSVCTVLANPSYA